MKNKTRLFLGITFGALVTPAFAHNTWLEKTGDGKLAVRYGDYGSRIEKSPGLLDNVDNLRAWQYADDGAVKSLAVKNLGDGLESVGADAARASFTSYISHSTKGHNSPTSMRTFCTRWQPAGVKAPESKLTLDVLPDEDAQGVLVVFRGKPLAGAELNLYGEAFEKPLKVKSDAEGRIRFTPKSAGLILVRVTHREDVAGHHEGSAYDKTSYITALTLARVEAAK